MRPCTMPFRRFSSGSNRMPRQLKGSGSLEAAAGAAAYGVLVGIYPKQQGVFDAKYKEFLASGGLAGNAGLAVGQQAAAALLKHHRPSTALPDYKGGSTPGAWRPTPSFIGSPPQPAPFSPMAYLYLMETKPYTLERPSQFRPEPPPALTSAAYLRDYNEVKALGARVSTTQDAGADRPRVFLGRQLRRAVEWRPSIDRGRAQDGHRRQCPSLCARQPRRRRRGDCLLGQQAALQLLASGYGDSGRRERRQRRRRSAMPTGSR